jgi:RNA polymerase sigma-70 factor (ECF subfamily)
MDRFTHNQIIQGLQQGDRQAWLKLYDAYAVRIWWQVSRLMGRDSGYVEDVVQETFLAAAQSAGTFDARRGSLWVWLWTIAQRQIALYYRKKRPTVNLDQALQWWSGLDGQKMEMLQRMEAPPELLACKELGVLVRHCLAKLPAEYQVLLLAKYVEGEPVDRLAEQFNCSSVAVRSKLARARKAFRRTFIMLTKNDPVVGRSTS